MLAKFAQILCSACEPQTMHSGVTDVIVVKDANGNLKSTAFYACIGTWDQFQSGNVNVEINGVDVAFEFELAVNGYLYPFHPNSEVLKQFNLKEGKNEIIYKTKCGFKLKAQIYLYLQSAKLVISDVDGTLTKSDVAGLYNNFYQKHFLHESYERLMEQIYNYGYKVVWLTMRSLPFYEMSKRYIKSHVKIDGPLIMEPQEFLLAIKKQTITKNSDLVKCTLLKTIRDLFPRRKTPSDYNPLAGGFGNRQNDAIAYHYTGISLQNIYIVDNLSKIQRLSDKQQEHTYASIHKKLQLYFPKIYSPNVRMYK